MTAFLIWIFGLSAWGAACNFPAWLALVVRWFTDPPDEYGRRKVRYLTSRLSLLLASVGLFFGSAVRASSLMREPWRATLPLYLDFPWFLNADGDLGLVLVGFVLPGWSQATWMVALALAEVLFLATAALQARTKHRRPLSLVIYVAGAVVWTAVAGRL